MSKSDKNALENIANTLKYVQEIFEQKNGYYFYFNYPNSKTKVLKIHKYNCGNCNYGTGKLKGNVGKNGVWIGPFSTEKQAESYIETYMVEYKSKTNLTCSCLKNYKL